MHEVCYRLHVRAMHAMLSLATFFCGHASRRSTLPDCWTGCRVYGLWHRYRWAVGAFRTEWNSGGLVGWLVCWLSDVLSVCCLSDGLLAGGWLPGWLACVYKTPEPPCCLRFLRADRLVYGLADTHRANTSVVSIPPQPCSAALLVSTKQCNLPDVTLATQPSAAAHATS